MNTSTPVVGLQLAAENFIDVTVNADYPLGRNKFKTVTFDARCRRLAPADMQRDMAALQRGDAEAAFDFVRKVLISVGGLKDFSGNALEIDSDKPETIEAFIATPALAPALVAAYIPNAVKTNRKN